MHAIEDIDQIKHEAIAAYNCSTTQDNESMVALDSKLEKRDTFSCKDAIIVV